MTPEPSAPPLEVLNDELIDYNCEAGCDVEFLVGSHPDVIRIPVHSNKLMEYPVFRAMLSERFAGNTNGMERGENEWGEVRRMRQIPLVDVDGKAFDNLMRFVYNKKLDLDMQTPEMVIETLKAAHKYLFPGLVWKCVKQMSTLISLNTVIWIYASVGYLCNDLENLEELVKSEANKPIPKRRKHSSIDISEGHLKTLELSAGSEIKRLCVWLLCQTLTFIDVHAGHVLQSDELEQLDYSFLEFLLKRDSLDVSESVVFSALIRWAESQCKRMHFTLTSQSKRQVLHDLIYQVRFFQMTDLEYRSGPEESGILSAAENQIIKNMIVYGHAGLIYENLTAYPELCKLCTHWNQMSQARFPRLSKHKNDFSGTGNAGKKRKWSSFSGKRKNSLRLKKVGGLVKNYCIPCSDTGNGKRRHTEPQITYANGHNQSVPSHQNNNASSYNNANHQNDGTKDPTSGGKRRKSTFSKAICLTVSVFAFFFD